MTSPLPPACHETNQQLNAYFDGELSEVDYHAIDQHLQECSNCSAVFTQRRQLLQTMQTMPSMQASPVLLQRIIKTRTAKQRQKVVWFSAGAASALAASIMLFAVIVALKPVGSITPSMNAVIASLNETQNINFVVHSESEMENVKFSVLIPGNIQIKGYSGLRELAWNGKLIKGDNLLTLPVIARDSTPGVLVMRVQHQGAQKEYRINVNIAGGRVS